MTYFESSDGNQEVAGGLNIFLLFSLPEGQLEGSQRMNLEIQAVGSLLSKRSEIKGSGENLYND